MPTTKGPTRSLINSKLGSSDTPFERQSLYDDIIFARFRSNRGQLKTRWETFI